MKKNNYFKVSFTGDIMCEKPLLKAAKKYGTYDFSNVFINVKELFHESDIIVGNLETVFAGEKAGYTKDLYSFNTPDEFAQALKESGVKYVSTANNHCLDRGIDGLKRTLEILDKNDIKHFGTARTEEESKKISLLNCEDKKIALLSYTYGTNIEDNHVYLNHNEKFHVNILKSQRNELIKFSKTVNVGSWRSKLSKIIRKFTTLEQRMRIKKFLGILKNAPKKDDIAEGDIVEANILKMKKDIERAKKEADTIIMCLHCGGLFNTDIGKYSQYIVNQLEEAGVDIVIGNHPHIVQKFSETIQGMKVAYSLGNLSISPSSLYVIHENQPDISVLLHLYFERETALIKKISFSLLKIVEDKSGTLSVYEVSELEQKLNQDDRKQLSNECAAVYQRFTGKNDDFRFQKEYSLL